MAPCNNDLVSELASRMLTIAGGVLAAILQPQSSCDHCESGDGWWVHPSADRAVWLAVGFCLLQQERGLVDADLSLGAERVSDWRAESLVWQQLRGAVVTATAWLLADSADSIADGSLATA